VGYQDEEQMSFKEHVDKVLAEIRRKESEEQGDGETEEKDDSETEEQDDSETNE
jgi:hypothetical protein